MLLYHHNTNVKRDIAAKQPRGLYRLALGFLRGHEPGQFQGSKTGKPAATEGLAP